VVVGDGFHNLIHGMIVGIAFSVCSGSTTGWVTTAAILVHEAPQEIIEFVILVYAGLSVWRAILFNFRSSMTSFFGVIAILALSGEISEQARALMLAFGAGSWLYCLHRTHSFNRWSRHSPKQDDQNVSRHYWCHPYWSAELVP